MILTKMYLDICILVLEGLSCASLPALLCRWHPLWRAASAAMGELRGECSLAGRRAGVDRAGGHSVLLLGLCGSPCIAPLHPRGCAWGPCPGLVLEVRKPELDAATAAAVGPGA